MAERVSSMHEKGRRRVQGQPCLLALGLDEIQCPEVVVARFLVDRDRVAARVAESGHEGVGVFDHEVNVEGQARDRPDRLHDHGTKRKIRHEMAVHHVHVDHIGAGCLHRAYFLFQVEEVCRKDARCNGNLHVNPLGLFVFRAPGRR